MTKKIFVDLETTGISPVKDRVVQVAVINIDGSEFSSLINPERVIPDEAAAIHGISNAMVKDAPKFGEVAERLRDMLIAADHFVAYNGVFDFQFLQAELHKTIGFDLDERKYTFVDPYRIFKTMFPQNLANAYRFYTGNELVNAHNAIVDIRATREILERQEQMYPEFFSHGYAHVARETIGNTTLLGKWFEIKDEQGVYFKQGKHKGEKVSLAHDGYLKWINNLDDITISEKRFVNEILSQLHSPHVKNS